MCCKCDELKKTVDDLILRVRELEDETGLGEKRDRKAYIKARVQWLKEHEGMSGRQASRQANNEVHFNNMVRIPGVNDG